MPRCLRFGTFWPLKLGAMNLPFTHHGQLGAACATWSQIPLTGLKPRRSLNLADKKADWKQTLSALKRFAASAAYQAPQTFEAHAALENYWHWQAMAEQARWLLIYGMDLGLEGNVLRPIYQEVVALWRDAAAVAEHARASLLQATGETHGVGAPVNTRSDDYRIAVTLLALATLLDAQDEVPAIVEQVLALDTDQLLDYLSAGGLELEQVSEQLFHQRPYGGMRPFFEQLEALPDPLLPYLQTQYAEFHKRSPKQQKKSGPWLGTGYWALEVGALAVLYGWDDSALRANPHYPADLVDAARARSLAANAD